MGTSLGPKYIPYTYMDPLGKFVERYETRVSATYQASTRFFAGCVVLRDTSPRVETHNQLPYSRIVFVRSHTQVL